MLNYLLVFTKHQFINLNPNLITFITPITAFIELSIIHLQKTLLSF